jgi:hypothetical protein
MIAASIPLQPVAVDPDDVVPIAADLDLLAPRQVAGRHLELPAPRQARRQHRVLQPLGDLALVAVETLVLGGQALGLAPAADEPFDEHEPGQRQQGAHPGNPPGDGGGERPGERTARRDDQGEDGVAEDHPGGGDVAGQRELPGVRLDEGGRRRPVPHVEGEAQVGHSRAGRQRHPAVGRQGLLGVDDVVPGRSVGRQRVDEPLDTGGQHPGDRQLPGGGGRADQSQPGGRLGRQRRRPPERCQPLGE